MIISWEDFCREDIDEIFPNSYEEGEEEGDEMLYSADFETTTDEYDCRVWAWGLVDIKNTSFFRHGNSITSMMRYLELSETNSTLYFHNLKFDGEFIIHWLLTNGYSHVTDRRDMETKTFTTLISDKNVFYSMCICMYKDEKISRKITIYDSLKILKLKVADLPKAFGLPLKKLDIDYKADRPVGHELTEQEISYLKNDCTIVAMALQKMFDMSLTKMTVGSNALHDYKVSIGGPNRFKKLFPPPLYDSDIRESYRGGYTYLNPHFAGMDIGEGIVLDVNSLYPSVMYYEALPYGEGIFFQGQYEEDKVYNLYVQMLRCQFELKPGKLPTLLKKNDLSVKLDYLTTSGPNYLTLCLTSVDLELFFEHYEIFDVEYLSGWKYKSSKGLFTDFIDKWNGIKVQASLEGNTALRTIAKFMLNNLYGKFALHPVVREKYPYLDTEEMRVRYKDGTKHNREPIYIPVGTFVTSYARNKTIRAAQSVHHRFVYADTDSLHLVGTELPEGLEISDSELGKWKHESTFSRARFIRSKSYIEEIDGKLNIVCAGMPDRCYPFVTWDNFQEGAKFAGALKGKRVQGGIVLFDFAFTIKK